MITVDEIKKIAGLAMLTIADEQLEAVQADYNEILAFADVVADVDLSKLDLTEVDDVLPLREDILVPSLPIEKITLNARESNGGYFVARM